MVGCKDVIKKKKKKGTDKDKTKDKPEWVDALEKRLVSVMESQNDMLLKRMSAMENKMNEKIEAIKTEMHKSFERIKDVEQKTNAMELELREENKNLKDQMMLMECKLLDNYIRFRGVPESEKDVREEMVNIISEFLEMPLDDVERECDDIYRVNSDFARVKKLPRDIIVRVITHKMRNLIFNRHYQEPLEVLGNRIKIWKELPKDLIKQRKEFKKLIDKFRQEQMQYRWEIQYGVSFLCNNKRFLIKTQTQMQEFFTNAKDEPGKSQVNQNNHNGN